QFNPRKARGAKPRAFFVYARDESADTSDIPESGRSVSGPAMSPLPRLPGYELLQLLGGGPLTHVFKARRSDTDQLCAVKLLRDEWACHATAIKLLRREAHALFSVRHLHVVRILDAHLTRPPYALALELLGGESL